MKRLTLFNDTRHAHRPGAILALLVSLAPMLAIEVTVAPKSPGPVLFARDEIKRAASTAILPDITLEISGTGEAQSYRLEHEGAKWRVVAADATGAMYGGLDFAEAIRLGSLADLKPGEHRAFIARRGIKFNIPLDLRTPSYSDNSDSAQANIPEVWSREFWREYFDEMARHRFNVLSLWNLNPFPSIVKVPEYPDFITAMPGPDKVVGFYMGPDGYCWGREAMALDPESPRQLVPRKQWFSFMLWGRLSYDPTLSDEFFERTLAARFPEVPADQLLAAWTAASRVIPEITRFIWGDIDLKWLPEACTSHRTYKGFYTVRDFIEGAGMPNSGDLTIREWRERLLAKQPMDGATPLQVAANLRREADTGLRGVAALRPKQGGNKELRLTLGDLEAFARLGQYYAAKIEGACELALFDTTSQPEHQKAAIKHLELALQRWREYAAVYTEQYRQPLLYNRVGIVDIPKLADQAAADIELARHWNPGTIGKAPPRKVSGSKFGQ